MSAKKIMSAKMVTIPFDLETAKKIMSGERRGSIVTEDDKREVEIVYQEEETKMIRPILAIIHDIYGPVSDWFSLSGIGNNYKLVLEVPEYITYKDGDLLRNREGDYLFILNTNGAYLTSSHVSLGRNNILCFSSENEEYAANSNNIELYNLANEDDKKRMIKALKASDDPKARTCLKKFFGVEEYDFKPFDRVLVKYYKDDDWDASLFIRTFIDNQDGKTKYECLNGTVYIYCIPFEGNENLLKENKDV